MNYLLTVRRAKFLRLCLLLSLLAFALLSPEARGAEVRHAGSTLADNAATRQRLQQWLQRQPGLPSGNGVQVAISVLPRTRPTRLLPCQRSEFFLPAGTRLWKRINVGERCVAGAGWTTWHAVDIRVHGPALLARQPLPAGSTPQPGDFSIQQVEWTAQPSAPLDIATALGNQELVRALAAGQPLRADHLRALPAIRAGEQVAAVTEGDGFRIAIDAIALASATEGQSVRVRTASGKVLMGMASGKTVKISR